MMASIAMIEKHCVGHHCAVATKHATLRGWLFKNDGMVIPKVGTFGKFVLLKDGGGTFKFSPSTVSSICTTYNKKKIYCKVRKVSL